MNEHDKKIAELIWPAHMHKHAAKVERAKRWLGRRYLLAIPLNRASTSRRVEG